MKPIRFHPRVRYDLQEAYAYYAVISDRLAEDFWEEISESIKRIESNPEAHHFAVSEMRRCNLKRFPYNILFIILHDRIRIGVLRHNSRAPSFGVRRLR
jgi:plasmid stabilization system protein ParE